MVFLAASNWWEPGSAGGFDIGDVVAFVAFFTGITTILVGISRWWMKTLRVVIKEEIEVATKPIHPSTNGGLSLADVARRTTHLETQMTELITQNNEIPEILKVMSAPKTTQKRRAS